MSSSKDVGSSVMPFTVSHPALILPFVRWFSAYGATPALVIGTMVPDAAYFIPSPWTERSSHSVQGLVTFCLPVGALAIMLYGLVLRQPLVFLLPSPLRHRLTMGHAVQQTVTGASVAVQALALLLGAVTHILWDSLATPGGVVLQTVPWARSNLATIGGYQLFVYRLVQHCGTIGGVVAIAWVIRRWCAEHPTIGVPMSSPTEGHLRLLVWLVILGVAALVGSYAATQRPLPSGWLQATRYFLHRAVVWGGRAACVALFTYSAVWWLRQSRVSRTVASS